MQGDMHIRLGGDFLDLFRTRLGDCANNDCAWHSINNDADGQWDCTLRTIRISSSGQCERFLQKVEAEEGDRGEKLMMDAPLSHMYGTHDFPTGVDMPVCSKCGLSPIGAHIWGDAEWTQFAVVCGVELKPEALALEVARREGREDGE